MWMVAIPSPKGLHVNNTNAAFSITVVVDFCVGFLYLWYGVAWSVVSVWKFGVREQSGMPLMRESSDTTFQY